ncbi:MAG: hypothetical protein KGJ66_01230 [Alphaproteobacteria bacterium]|nr:hypothetical protein [Alphaproteobacteria bacterium]
MTGWSLAASPLLPWDAIGAFAAAALLLVAFGFWRRARGTGLRLLAVLALAAIVVNPSLVEEKRAPQRDVAAVIVDDSQSMTIGQRQAVAATALKSVTDQLARLHGVDVRVVHAGTPDPSSPLANEGTQLYTALNHALADVPRQRVAGAILITDGQIHDMPPPAQLAFHAPLHVLLTGRPGEEDRRLVVRNAPKFGLVGKTVTLAVRVEDLPKTDAVAEAQLTLRKDGGLPVIRTVPVGQDVDIPVTIDHGGPNIVELSVNAGPHELTLTNNRAAFVINGVRDRLKVLLVSGKPNQDERTWRNILKSDPSVDLIHFTILRPPEKQDGTPIRELSLIAFPIRELFDVKLHSFDLIIFDRYRQRSVLPQAYLENIANYVREGGALLVSAGPAFATPLSLYRTPLGSVLPAEPTGDVFDKGFVPEVTAIGQRDPITEDLPELPAKPGAMPPWGRWFRDIGAQAQRGVTVMTGYQGEPLLVLDRVGKGRVAQLMSDEMWLWTRGYEGGGPQVELLRRVIYWLMKEPDLEENDLRAVINGDKLTITRQSLQPDDSPVQVTQPDGKIETIKLSPEHGGRSSATLAVNESGLYRVSDGQRTALAAAGALNPIEMSDVRTTDDKVKADVAATGGGIFWVGSGRLPEIQLVDPGQSTAGSGWIGLRRNGDYIVTGVGETPLLSGVLALILALGLLILAWRREGR